MKIYVVTLDMTQVLGRLKKYRLREFNQQFPSIFIEAADPDEACYLCYCKFAETILRQDASDKTASLIKKLEHDLRNTKVICKDEKKL